MTKAPVTFVVFLDPLPFQSLSRGRACPGKSPFADSVWRAERTRIRLLAYACVFVLGRTRWADTCPKHHPILDRAAGRKHVPKYIANRGIFTSHKPQPVVLLHTETHCSLC